MYLLCQVLRRGTVQRCLGPFLKNIQQLIAGQHPRPRISCLRLPQELSFLCSTIAPISEFQWGQAFYEQALYGL